MNSYEHTLSKIEGKSLLEIETMVERSLNMPLVSCMNVSPDGDITLRIVDEDSGKASVFILSDGDTILWDAYGQGLEVVN